MKSMSGFEEPKDQVQYKKRESSISTPFSCYREDSPRSSSRVKSTGKYSCNCFTKEQPRKYVSKTAEEIRRTVRAEIAEMEQKQAMADKNGCDFTFCKPPQSGRLSSNEETKSKSKDEEIFTESEKLILSKIDWRTTATNDLANSEVIYSTIKRLLRVCLNNKIIELGLLDSLHDAIAQFKRDN